MKKFIVVCMIAILIGLNAFAQEQSSPNDYPGSTIDISAGVGKNHGIIGVKSVLGYKGTGLMFAVVSFDGFTTCS